MARHVVLLRGINIGPHNRIAMPALRELLSDAGFESVRTYVQSGNILLDSPELPGRRHGANRAADHRGARAEHRRGDPFAHELAAVVEHNPLGKWADNPKRYQVSFLSDEIASEDVQKLADIATESERFAARGRELYAWFPDGIARSKLSTRLAGTSLGVTATSRNWTTVTTLLSLADE